MKNDYLIMALCQNLEVSPSGYWDGQHRRAAPGPRPVENQTLIQQIDQLYTQSRQTYGSPRIVAELFKQGRRHGRNRIARLLVRQVGMRGRQQGHYRVQTTGSNDDEPIAPNRLAEVPKATAPNQFWVSALPSRALISSGV